MMKTELEYFNENYSGTPTSDFLKPYIMNAYRHGHESKDAEITHWKGGYNAAQEVIKELGEEIKSLKEKEIRGDRMIVDLEHKKTVLNADNKRQSETIKLLTEALEKIKEKNYLVQFQSNITSHFLCHEETVSIAESALEQSNPPFES